MGKYNHPSVDLYQDLQKQINDLKRRVNSLSRGSKSTAPSLNAVDVSIMALGDGIIYIDRDDNSFHYISGGNDYRLTGAAPGAAGAFAEFVFVQPTPATVWIIDHMLDGYPAVTAVDVTNTEVEGDVQYTSVNQVVITFSVAVAGKAFLS